MNKNPAISVVMSAYNASKFLKEAVESILNQTFQNFEFIMINDGSSDNTLEILQHYAQIDSRCIVLSWDNKGIIESVNHGIKLAKADIICRMDADDISLPNRFEKQIEYLNSHSECVALGTNALLIDPEGMPINTWIYEQDHDEIDAANLKGTYGSRFCNPSVAIRKESILSIGGYRTGYEWAEDYDLFLRLAEIGKLANVPEALVKYRQHVESVGHAKRILQLEASISALEDTFKRRNLTFDLKTDLKKKANEYSPPSKSETELKWGWWALSEKNYLTSLKYATKALLQNPFNFKGINLLACVIRDFYFK